MTAEAFSILSLGFLLGLRHAFDADHVIAISTIVSERRSMLHSSVIGMYWGIGHTFSLLAAGCLVLLLGVAIPERVGMAMEFGVALMLVGLGGRVLWKIARGERLHVHRHTHGERAHIHPHLHTVSSGADPGGIAPDGHHRIGMYSRAANMSGSWRPVVVGIVHGMAGSAGLMLIVLATIGSRALALLYILLFGIGSIGGMFLMSSLIGLPFLFTANISGKLPAALRALSGVVSVGFGLFLAWEIGVAGGLLF